MPVTSGGTDQYVERLATNLEDNVELVTEIAKRENSAMREKGNKYDQWHATSKMLPPLIEVREAKLSRQSTIYKRVQSFEEAEQQSKVVLGPKIEDLKCRRETKNPNRFASSDALPLPVYSLRKRWTCY